MAGARKPGPLGRNPEGQDLNDGTLFRGLSPLPGPIGARPTATHRGLITDTAYTSDVDHMLQRLRAASNGIAPTIDFYRLLQLLRDAIRGASNFIDLQEVTVTVFGSQCFAAGAIIGIGEDIISDAVDLIKLCWRLFLADLHDIRTGKVIGIRKLVDPSFSFRQGIANVVGELWPEKLREAAAERDALLNELMEALKNPQELLVGMAKGVWEEYQRDWQEFNKHMDSGTLEGRFHAGRIFGKVLVVVIGCITLIGGMAKLAAKLGIRFPRLLKYATQLREKVGKLKGKHEKGGSPESDSNVLSDRVETPPDQTKPVPTTTQPAAAPAKPPTTKPGGSGKSSGKSSSGAAKKAPKKQQQKQSSHKPSKDQSDAQKRQKAAQSMPEPEVVQQDIKNPNVRVGSGEPWTGRGAEPQWDNPLSKAYGHTESDHGPKRDPQQLIDRAKGDKTSDRQGQWYNSEDWVLAERAAPKHPGRYVIDFERPVGRVWNKDGTAAENMTKAVVLRRRDGTITSSYPVLPNYKLLPE